MKPHHQKLSTKSGVLAVYYGLDWPGITALLAGENSHMHYYPIPAKRPMGDVDIITDSDHYQNVIRLLEVNG